MRLFGSPPPNGYDLSVLVPASSPRTLGPFLFVGQIAGEGSLGVETGQTRILEIAPFAWANPRHGRFRPMDRNLEVPYLCADRRGKLVSKRQRGGGSYQDTSGGL